jgi:predicted RNA-binding protein YlxR (DUF448 family)
MSASQPTTKKRRGPRPKHVPQRTCIACGEKDAKRDYVRIVRTPEGTVEIDTTGKRNGRGAYLCRTRRCWERALETRAIERHLKVIVDEAKQAELRHYARTRFAPDTA